MGMTILEKIFARASGRPVVRPGDLVVVDVDLTMLLDTAFHRNRSQEVLKIHDPDKVVVVYDHYVPAPEGAHAQGQSDGRKFVEQFGIQRFHDVGREQGIGHSVLADYGYALPGEVLVCSDSHTCASGAFNCAARGVGPDDLVASLVTGKTWYKVGGTVRYELTGSLRPGVTAKDLFLYIATTWGDHVNLNVEYGGPGLASLPISARRTVAAMGAELSAEFSTFEADQLLIDYLKARNPRPFTPQYPDADANYVDRRTIDLATVPTLVAKPDAVIRNGFPVAEVAGVRIDQAFIGSCANGSLDDLADAARVVKGKKVAPGVRFLVTPGTQKVYREAMAAGYIQSLVDAGAVITPATCGACFGGHMGVVGPDEVCITASTRNFKGRMGHPTARIYMASPATVAASAIAGRIAGADHPVEAA